MRRVRGRRWIVILATVALVAVAVAIYFLSFAGGAPVLAFDKLQVDLGVVPRTQQGTQTFLVMNRGSKPLTVGPVELDVQEGCDQIGVATDSLFLKPNETEQLTITFGRHQQLGPHRVRIHVPSNDPKTPSARLSLRFVVEEDATATGTGPRLAVDKNRINIGFVPYDWPLYEQFTLRNIGDAPLILTADPVVRVEEGC